MRVLLFILTLGLATATVSSFAGGSREEAGNGGQRVGEVIGATAGAAASGAAAGAALGTMGSQAGGAAGRAVAEGAYDKGIAIRNDLNRDATGGSERLKSQNYDVQMNRAQTK